MWKRLLNFLVYDNWLIAGAAVALTLNTTFLLGFPIQAKPYLFVVFFATMFIYCMHRLLGVLNQNQSDTDRYNWAKHHKKTLKLTTALALVALLVAIFFARQKIDIFLLPFAIIAIGYSIPIVRKNAIMLRLRDLPLAKTFLVAGVWAGVTVLLPVLYKEMSIFLEKKIVLLLMTRFFFMLALTIPFDIRDQQEDADAGVRSIAVVLGHKWSKVLALLCITGYTLLNTCLFSQELRLWLPLLLTALFVAYLVKKTGPASTEYHYLLWLDGAMLIEFLLLLAFSF